MPMTDTARRAFARVGKQIEIERISARVVDAALEWRRAREAVALPPAGKHAAAQYDKAIRALRTETELLATLRVELEQLR